MATSHRLIWEEICQEPEVDKLHWQEGIIANKHSRSLIHPTPKLTPDMLLAESNSQMT